MQDLGVLRRILADAEGLVAEDYERDRVHISDLYKGCRTIEDFDSDLVAQSYYSDAGGILAGDLGLEDLKPNEFVVFDNGKVRHLFRNASGVLRIVRKDFKGLGIKPRNMEQRMALDLLMDPEVQLVTMIGKAGTGKTFLALAAALAQMDVNGPFKNLLLSKPTLAMGHSDVGFLPGTLEEKMEPWMQSFFDNFDQLITTPQSQRRRGEERNWEYLIHSGAMKLQTIHTIRGRSIPNALMFIDEAQNLTPHEIKTIITRAAVGPKVVLSGDPFQCDSRFLDQHSNGLTYVTERMKDQHRFGTVFIQSGVRSELSDLAASLL